MQPLKIEFHKNFAPAFREALTFYSCTVKEYPGSDDDIVIFEVAMSVKSAYALGLDTMDLTRKNAEYIRMLKYQPN